jgi:hypothetical protein
LNWFIMLCNPESHAVAMKMEYSARSTRNARRTGRHL